MWIRTGCLGVFALLALSCAAEPKHKVDESILRDIPPSQKQAMLDVQAQMDRAAAEREWAQNSFEEAKQDVQLARTTRRQAKLEVNTDQSRLAQAERLKDNDAIRDARDRLGVSRLGVSGAEARIIWLEQRQRVHQAEVNLADARLRAAKARYELEKARLAQRENRRPSRDFQLSEFDQQLALQEREVQIARDQVKDQQTQAMHLQDQYGQLAQQYNQERTRVPGVEPSFILPAPTTTQRAKAPAPSTM